LPHFFIKRCTATGRHKPPAPYGGLLAYRFSLERLRKAGAAWWFEHLLKVFVRTMIVRWQKIGMHRLGEKRCNWEKMLLQP